MSKVKVLLVQLASNGDCLFATSIAKQIKIIDYVGCELSWMIGRAYVGILQNNPFVDNVILIDINKTTEIEDQRKLIPRYIEELGGYEYFDKIFITEYRDINASKWFGTIRSSIFRCYPNALKISTDPVIILTDQEKIRVKKFCAENLITKTTFNILFECNPLSGQSQIDFQVAQIISKALTRVYDDVRIILSSNISFVPESNQLIDGSYLSFRENADLINYCDLLIGGSSGISWLSMSTACRPINKLQIIKADTYGLWVTPSMRIDCLFHGSSDNQIIEIYELDPMVIINIIKTLRERSFLCAKYKFEKIFLPAYGHFPFYRMVVTKFFCEGFNPNLFKLWLILTPSNLFVFFNDSLKKLSQLNKSFKIKFLQLLF